MELQIGTIAIVPIIVALIQVAKKLGLPSHLAPWVNGGLALVFFALMTVVTQQPELLAPVTIGLNALIIFLVGAGVYDRLEKPLRL